MVNSPDAGIPSDDARIWRIMDVPKLLAMLVGKCLFLPRASALEDEHEGAFPPHQPPISRVLRLVPPGALVNAIQVNTSPGMLELGRDLRDWVFISSWYLAEHESAALWSVYGRGQGVAIRSSVGRVRKAVGAVTPFRTDAHTFALEPQLGAVRYIDYATASIPTERLLAPFFHKRLEFEAEREFRLICAFLPQGEHGADLRSQAPWPGVSATANLSDLVESVWLGPETPDWQARTLTEVLKTYGVNAPTFPSAMRARPTY
jgi:hypothetical protein